MHGFLSRPFDAMYYRFALSFAVFDQRVCSFRLQLKKIDFSGNSSWKKSISVLTTDKIVVGPALSTKSSITEGVC